MRSIVEVIKKDIEAVDRVLSIKDAIREEAYRLVRELVRESGSIITLVHRGMVEDAKTRLEAARIIARRLKEITSSHPDLYYSGMIYNGLSEYVEAVLFYSIIVEGRALPLSELDIPYAPYLQGLGDLIGELRRYIIKLLDEGLVKRAEEYLEVAEEIYSSLKTLEYPDALTPGLRHKVDVASRLIEETRVLILNTKNAYLCAGGTRETSIQESCGNPPLNSAFDQ